MFALKNKDRLREQEERRQKLLVILPLLSEKIKERLLQEDVSNSERRDLEFAQKSIPKMLARLNVLESANNFGLSRLMNSGVELRTIERVCEVKQLRVFLKLSLDVMTRSLAENGMKMPFVLVTLYRLYHEDDEGSMSVEEPKTDPGEMKATAPWFPTAR
jgi:hypothetical protein